MPPKKAKPTASQRNLRSKGPLPKDRKEIAVSKSKAPLALDQDTVIHGSSAQGSEQKPTPTGKKPTTVSSGKGKGSKSVSLEKEG